MKVIVVRHGETYGNINRIVEGRSHGRLTYHGMEQAQAVAEQLRHEPIDIVYSSNLQRAFDTAFILAEYHPRAPLVPVHELRERNQGTYEGVGYNEVPYQQYEGEFVHVAPPDGESWRDVERRVGLFLNGLYAIHPQATILVVTHTGPTKAIRSLLTGVPLRESIDRFVPNASVHYFAMDSPTRMGSDVAEAL